jgi:hypothetical protein
MLYGSGSRTGCGSGFNIKWNKKKQNERPDFWEKYAAADIEKARCTNFLLLENCAKYCLDPEPAPEQQKIITGTVPKHC